jgi:hypothetical protein
MKMRKENLAVALRMALRTMDYRAKEIDGKPDRSAFAQGLRDVLEGLDKGERIEVVE